MWLNHDTGVAVPLGSRRRRSTSSPPCPATARTYFASPRAFASAASSRTENPGVWLYSSVPCVP